MSAPRKIIPLDGDWEFAYTRGAADDGGDLELPGRSWYETSVPVPGYWDDNVGRLELTTFWSRYAQFNPDYREIRLPMGTGKPADASLPFLLGTGWHKTTFAAPEDWAERTVTLRVGGVSLEAWVWLNGQLVRHHIGHLTSFEIPLGDGLVAGGVNELVIAVSNTRLDRVGCSIRGFAGRSGGITRSVELIVTGTRRIADLFVHPDDELQKLTWSAEIQGAAGADADTIAWAIEDTATGALISEGSTPAADRTVRWSSPADGLEPWSDLDPRLYTLRAVLRRDGTELDTVTQSFGMRVLRTDGMGLRLNGTPVFLRGATDHAYFPETTTPPTDVAYYRDALRQLKRIGFNWIRFHTWTPPEECLIAADEIGMLLQVETPNGYRQSDLIDVLRVCRAHPSVVLYCCGNEVPIDDAMLDQLEESAGHVKAWAPEVLFDPMEALHSVEYHLDESDPEYVAEPHPHHAGRLQRLEQFSDVFAPHGSIFSYHSLATDTATIDRRLERHNRPCLMHEVGITDSFLDLSLEQRYEGTRTGTALFASARRYLTDKGAIDRAPTYHRNSVRWQQLVLKFALENTRRSSRVAGYDLLGAIDCHWHRSGYGVGIMNEFYELKTGTTEEAVLAYNGESVLLADCGTRRNLRAGEVREVPLHVSVFGAGDVTQGDLDWTLVDDRGTVVDRGRIEVPHASAGAVTSLGALAVRAPEVPDGRRITLEATLTDGRRRIRNSWDFWVFPASVPVPPGVRVTDTLDAETVDWVARGGRLVLRGAGPFPSLPTTFQIMSGGRTRGNNATVVADHPALAGFPHDGYCDWQFAPMLDGGAAVVFSDLDVEFDPIVEVVSGYKVVRPQSAVFELAVGCGRIVVCSLNLASDPGADYLAGLLARWVDSEDFDAAATVSPEEMLQILGNRVQMDEDMSTDEAYDDGGHPHPID